MSPELEKQLDIFCRSFAIEYSSEWDYFYCPILRISERTELCLGHVISKELPNSSNATVPQRKDVDSFFGRTVEIAYINSVRAYPKSLFEIFQHPDLRRFVKPTLDIGGHKLEYYAVETDDEGCAAGNMSNNHALMQLENPDGSREHFGLKVDGEGLALLSAENQIQATAEVDCSACAVACLLHSAHLTMFKMLKYRYVFSSGGMFLANILRDFYLKYRDNRHLDIPTIANNYFEQYRNLVRPLSERPKWSHGTVSDNKMLVWEDTSGRHLAFGVMVNVSGMMHIVWLQSNDPEAVPEFLSLFTSPPQFMVLRVVEIVFDGSDNYTFRYDPRAIRVELKTDEIDPYFNE